MKLPTGRLCFTPGSQPSVAWGKLEIQLRRIGFLGPALSENAYQVGEHFFHLILFTGCAVQISLEPTEGPFCHIRFLGPFDPPRLLRGRNSRPPRCPRCRSPYRAFSQLPAIPAPRLRCPSCARETPLENWDWKHSGGLGRQFLLVEEIFPGEAVPDPKLLQALETLSGAPWSYFYQQD